MSETLTEEHSAKARQVAGQGALLFSGFAMAQGLSFGRNALIGHALSKGDFGIAATVTLMLQLLDTLSDLGADRLVVQAADGDEDRFLATTHSALAARGILICLILFIFSGPLAAFFLIPDAQWAFAAASLGPLLKGFQHLDCRRAQRHLDNRPQMMIEVMPQAVALAMTVPALAFFPGYQAVVWLALLQAAATFAVSHLVSTGAYRLGFDRAILNRLIVFGWPIWASALPLIAVYQIDRIIVGRILGMEALAAYTAAFMITMVPGLIASKVGHALMLPLFSEAKRRDGNITNRFALLSEATALAASVYVVLFFIAGGKVLSLAFGPNYAGLDYVICAFALVWALRMMQAVPGMALMAAGETRPFLVAGMIRATALPIAFAFAELGKGLHWIAAAGVAGEFLSFIYIAARIEYAEAGLGKMFAKASLLLVPSAITACVASSAVTGYPRFGPSVATAALVTALVVSAALMALPRLRLAARMLHAAEKRSQINPT